VTARRRLYDGARAAYPKLGRFLGYTVRDGSLLSEAALDPKRQSFVR
jgi:hypothetical protein